MATSLTLDLDGLSLSVTVEKFVLLDVSKEVFEMERMKDGRWRICMSKNLYAKFMKAEMANQGQE